MEHPRPITSLTPLDLGRGLQFRCTNRQVMRRWVRAPQQSWAAWRRGKAASSCRNLWQGKGYKKKINLWGFFFNYIPPHFHPDTVCSAGGWTAPGLPPPLCLSERFCGEISSPEFLLWHDTRVSTTLVLCHPRGAESPRRSHPPLLHCPAKCCGR